MISIYNAIKKMMSGEPVTLDVVAYDKKRGTGGQIKKYEKVRLLSHQMMNELGAVRWGVKRLNKARERKIAELRPDNRILRIMLRNGDIVSIHQVLIVKFNGEQVAL